jgi:hypothetical protein
MISQIMEQFGLPFSEYSKIFPFLPQRKYEKEIIFRITGVLDFAYRPVF